MITTITKIHTDGQAANATLNNYSDKVEKVELAAGNKQEKPLPSYDKYPFLIWEFETPIIWSNVIFITLWHLIAVYYFIHYPSILSKLPLVLYGCVIGGISGFGITGGAHRYFTHRTYKAKLPLKILLLISYAVAGQNQLFDWVRDHRVHHKFSESNADPHNASRGFFFSHVGWLMMKKHPDVIRKGRTIDMSDITDDPLIQVYQKYWFWIKLAFCFIIPSAIPVYLYGEDWFWSIITICFIRYVISLNSTWAVNSFAHIWGYRPYDKRIFPSENLAVSFFAMGEGYHNYHHTFPWDYRAAELGTMLNVTTLWLNIFKSIGWAYDLKAPSGELIRKVVENNGDGTHYRWGHEVAEECEGAAGDEEVKEEEEEVEEKKEM
ncbi:unnamed protein product [Phyllotreta striolata]|uniref:Fatty acid desaturase domain-containing protein n=1 Tax=Phyllotreta striolata TaxID=444603 RepID=A0A9N9TZL3_PHYSR|nr:unnamed protein product [Phyllotreta striolata]